MTRARIQRSFPLAIVHQHALFCKIPRSFNKLTNITLYISHFTLLHDQNFIHWTPNLAILTTKTFDCFQSLPRNSNTIPKLIYGQFGRWQMIMIFLEQQQVWGSKERDHSDLYFIYFHPSVLACLGLFQITKEYFWTVKPLMCDWDGLGWMDL